MRSNVAVERFESAVAAVVSGDGMALRSLLREDQGLLRALDAQPPCNAARQWISNGRHATVAGPKRAVRINLTYSGQSDLRAQRRQLNCFWVSDRRRLGTSP
jgi:hypothetical protein